MTPTKTPELTVESALAELREMFGPTWMQVIVGLDCNGRYYQVKVYGKPHMRPTTVLEEAMAQVRQWCKEQQ